MCFIASVEETKKYHQKLRGLKQGYARAFKVVRLCGASRTRMTPRVRSLVKDHIWSAGTHEARDLGFFGARDAAKVVRTVNRVRTRPRRMRGGFYVFQKRPHVSRACGERVLVVRVRAEELIGADEEVACFRKVQVSAADNPDLRRYL